MKVQVDATKCEGYGTCAEHLASLFELDEWGYATAAGDGTVPPGDEDLARRAIADCPVHAIRVLDE
jgi:ferredoxin